MKTLMPLKNTTDVVAIKADVNKIPEYHTYAMITKRIDADITMLINKQEMTLDDFITLHKFIYTPVTHALRAGVKEKGAINSLLNGMVFGITTLHDIAPRLATWYVDIICHPSIAAELPVKNKVLMIMDMLESSMSLHHYFANPLMAIIAHHKVLGDMPEPDENTLASIHEFRTAFIRTLTPRKTA